MNKPYSSTILVLCGIILMGLGLYFVVLRPPLLPEDPRYMGASLAEIQATVPGLFHWLQKVFWVMGGYIFTTGLLTLYVAITAFRMRAAGAVWIVAAAGLTSIGWMAVVNFIIGEVGRLTMFLFLVPVLGLGIAALTFGERISLLEGIGSALTIIGVGIVELSNARSQPTPQTA